MSDLVAAQFQQALSLLQQGNIAAAQQQFLALITQVPELADAWFLLALCQSQLGAQAQAIESNAQAIRCNPHFVEAYINRGADLCALGCYAEALADLQQALSLNPAHPQALLNLGNVQRELGQLEAAKASFGKALELSPTYVDAWCNLADVLSRLGNKTDAVHACHEALRREPNAVPCFNTLGLIYAANKQHDLAMDAYEQAIRLNPQYVAAYNNLALLLMVLKRLDVARLVLEQALALDPRNPAANNNIGNLLMNMGQPQVAVGYLQAAYDVDPSHEYVTGTLLHAKMKTCDWRGYEALLASALEGVSANKTTTQTFPLLATPSTLAQQQRCAEHYVARQFGQIKPFLPSVKRQPRPKVRIAYLSADFFNHATAFLMAELFELHDRERFEIIGICYGRSPDDEMRRRVSQAFDQFHAVADRSDLEIAELIQTLGVDITVDLKGHTTDARFGILAYRPAPVQVHYLGYPGTTGTDFIDYLIADPVLVPVEHQQTYTEKIAYLPDCYQVNDSKRPISDRRFMRSELGLPETGFVFCSFNNNFKITPDLFDVWMRLLKRVPDSVLWLFQDSAPVADNLSKEASARGVDASRLVFAERMPLPEHLARHRCADLFLDTWYYNAHTTASDALWAGLPLVTKIGDTFAGRVAASLLTAIGLPELITETPQAYEELAYELATNHAKLQALKNKLEQNRQTESLFDTPRFTRNLERVYEDMLNNRRS